MADLAITPRVRCDNCGTTTDKVRELYSLDGKFMRPSDWGTVRVDPTNRRTRVAIAALQAGEAATELLGRKPGERAAQGTPADAKAGETSPSNPSVADAPAKVADGTRVVHVYGEKWLTASPSPTGGDKPAAPSSALREEDNG